MRGMIMAAAIVAAVGGAAQAQETERTFERPYWLDRSVIEVIGRARLETQANRARFSVTFEETAREAVEAQAAAADRARLATAAMRRAGGDQVQIASEISVEPQYQEYRDREGNVQQREGAQNISGYAGRVTLTVRVLNTQRAAAVRAAAFAVGPEESGGLQYYLDETSELQRRVYTAAVEDATARARAAAQATGRSAGALLVLQEGQGPCLGRWSSTPSGRDERRGDVYASPAPVVAPDEAIVVTGSGRRELRLTPEDIARFQLPDDPPPLTLQSQVCAVFAVTQ